MLREDGTLRRHRDETQQPCEGSWSLPQRREIPDVLRLPHDEEDQDDEHPPDA